MALLTPEIVYRRWETDGVPDSGKHEPVKSEIIQLLTMLFGISRGGWVVTKTKAELVATTPASETDGGLVLDDPIAANNGYYSRAGSLWARGRGLPDTFARLNITGGTANAIVAEIADGVVPAEVQVFFIKPSQTNTGAVTLALGGTVKSVKNVLGANLTVGQWTANRMIMLVDDGAEYRLLSDPDIDGMLATVIALVEDAEQLATPGPGTVVPASIDPDEIAAFKTLFGITASTAIGRAINGLVLSNNPTTPNTILNIGVGSARDKDQTMDMVVAVGWTKTTATWVAGTGNGMLDTGTIAANKGYHVFLIYNPTTGLYDYRCSLSATAPTMPSGFTKRRRIGFFTTDASANIRKGVWYANGDFTHQHGFIVVDGAPGDVVVLKQMPVALGVKVKIKGQVFGASSGNVAFWPIIRDPDLGAPDATAEAWFDATVYKQAGSNDGGFFDCWTRYLWAGLPRGIPASFDAPNLHLFPGVDRHAGRILMTQPIFTIGLLGSSDVQSYSCRDWPLRLCQNLQVGRASMVRRMGFGRAIGSTVDISSGAVASLAAMRCDATLLSFYKDAAPTLHVSPAQSLANMYTTIDAIRTQRGDTRIFLLKTWRLQAVNEAATFPKLASYWEQYQIAAANRGVGIIDAYTAWGDPALHPEEFDPIDPLHPLLAGLQRVTIPQAETALGHLIR